MICASREEGGLGYCCPYIFFSRYTQGPVTMRLGCSHTTYQRWKEKVREGKVKCEGRDNCMKARLLRKP